MRLLCSDAEIPKRACDPNRGMFAEHRCSEWCAHKQLPPLALPDCEPLFPDRSPFHQQSSHGARGCKKAVHVLCLPYLASSKKESGMAISITAVPWGGRSARPRARPPSVPAGASLPRRCQCAAPRTPHDPLQTTAHRSRRPSPGSRRGHPSRL